MTRLRASGRLISIATVAVFCVATATGCRARGEGVTPPPGSSAPQPGPAPNATSARPRIVVLGDSLTAGLGLVEDEAYPALLQERIDAAGFAFEVENAGVSGDTSAGGLRRLDWALDGPVKVLIVALGGNDGLRGLSAADLKQNLTEIVNRAQRRGIAVIIAGMEAPPNYGQEYATGFRQVYRDVARERHVLLIPFLLDRVAGISDLNQPDGIHPNAKGAAIVADNVWAVLQPVLRQIAAGS